MYAKNANALFEQASALYRKGKYSEAISLLDQLNEAFPDTRRVMYPRARCLAKLGRTDEALFICDELINIHGYEPASDLKNLIVIGAEGPDAPGQAQHDAPIDDQALAGDANRSPVFREAPPTPARGGAPRWIVFGGIAVVSVLIVLLGIVVVLGALQSGPGIDSPWSLIPGNASAIGQVDVERLSAIPAMRGVIASAQGTEAFESFELAGVSPRNIGRVHFGGYPTNSVGPDAGAGVALIDFLTPVDEAMLLDALKEADLFAGTEAAGGRSLHLIRTDEVGQRTALALLSETRMLMGTWDAVQVSANLADGEGRSAADNGQLMSLMKGGNQNGILSIAAIMPEAGLGNLSGEAIGSSVRPDQIDSLLIALDYQDNPGLSLDLSLECESDDVAASIHEDLKGMKMMAAFVGLPPENISIEQKKSTVSVNVVLPTDLMNSMAQSVPATFMRGSGAFGQSSQTPTTPVDEAAQTRKSIERLSTGMSYDDVNALLGTTGVRKGSIGNQERYDWLLPGDIVLTATFEDGSLKSWDAEN